MKVKLATAPVSWGVDHMGRPNLPPWETVFDQVANAGFKFTELGPFGYLPEDPVYVRTQLEQRGLQAVGAALLASLADPVKEKETTDQARRLSSLIAGSGGKFLVLVDWSPDRHRTAGRSHESTRLSGDSLKTFHSFVERIAKMAHEEFDLQAVAHPHAGSYLEFEDEIESLLENTESKVVKLAIDTGHSLYAGIDPSALYERHAQRTAYVNLKDLSLPVYQQSMEDRLSFLDTVDRGVFCPLGRGDVDFVRFVGALKESNFAGPVVIEQDRDPSGFPAAFTDAVASLKYVTSLGL